MGLPRAAWTTAAAIALALLAAGSASGFQFKSCVSAGGAGPCGGVGGNTSALDNPSAVVVSPDGRYVYSAALDGDAISVFARDQASGALSFQGCVRGPNDTGPCAALNHTRLLDGPSALAMSPDGEHIYEAASVGDELATFRRDKDTGALTFAGCMSTNGGDGCIAINNGVLDAPVALAMGPDGDELYVAGANQSSVGVFSRNHDTGLLAFFSCWGAAPECPDLPGAPNPNDQLATPSGLAVSPDGRFLYAAARNADGLAVFRTDQSLHALTYIGCIRATAIPGCTSIGNSNALDGPAALAASQDGVHLYVAAREGNAVAAFARDQAGGLLSFAGCDGVTNVGPCTGIGNGNAVTAPAALAIGPAGGRVYSAAATGDAIAGFARDPAGSPLSFLGCVGADASGPCTSAGSTAAFDSPVALAVSPDGRNLYSAASTGEAIGVLGIAPPACAPLGASTAFGAAVQLKLSCPEPDGDPVTYSVGAAGQGGLSGFDPAGGTVVYTPNAGFSGADGFQFGASDIDGGSTAGASIAVAAPPVTTPPQRITSPIRNRWAAGPRRTRIIQLRARFVPGNATVEVRCSAPKRLGRRACPFKRKSARPKADGATVDLRLLFGRHDRLRVGVRVQIRITAPGAIGKVVTYTMRRSKLPKSVARCLPVGATKPATTC
jgi:6-phosphogluconolactonase (cycloisomerase 2 family)